MSDITGAILAGGRGMRMGGEDKGLLLLNGRPLVEHVIERLRPQVSSLLVNANRNRTDYEAFGYPVVSDHHDEYPGPLAGMAAVLRHADTDWVQCVPCDTPALPTCLVQRLTDALSNAPEALIALPHDGERMQPLFALLHRSLLPELDADIAAGRLAVGRWMRDHAHVEVDFSDYPEAFANLNTPEELAAHQG
ncbi:molybdenum cofactor guanylyltransferase MobA [Thioalkalivibrio sulfidiphilus]|uniref:Molybdenum cofactor guanylyltransferase n=1 Tax=Thioalkalivibrio sulfidiphilus (strain HL-EbGR7) TaxID=396588 RepID=B8GTW6_THISH|nr:molybdenum cofactor guanylyltransferase MobA [Thioalkalivibrio sulfidiphilus]ACL73210.1 molybdopterin-guanine dinucleotide biosynthesis protein A [Thioalkalivibrio sulfidiphilus HL-EbGr7]